MTEHSHHQHQRRPPDVEEALSSMLWTPYERSPSDSSSEDDDEKLNKRLRKSHSSYDYASLATSATASATAAAATAFVPLTTSYFGCDNMLLSDANATAADIAAAANLSTAAPFVPLSNIMFSSNLPPGSSQQHALPTVTNNNMFRPLAASPNYQKNNDDATNNYRFSYPYYGHISSLNKWWPTTPLVTAAGMTTNAAELPSYDSLYAKSSRTRAALKPVLKSLRAITTISGTAEVLETESARFENRGVARLVHSFTDDFISENCNASSAVLPTVISNNINNNVHPHSQEEHQPQQQQQQRQQPMSTWHDQLCIVNNVAEHKNNNNNSDVTLRTKQQQQQSAQHLNNNNNNCMQKVVVDNNQYEQQQQKHVQLMQLHTNDNNNKEEQETNVHEQQVNQPVSVAQPIYKMNSTTTTAKANSPTNSTTTAAEIIAGDNAAVTLRNCDTNERRSLGAATLASTAQTTTAAISLSRAANECGCPASFTCASTSSFSSSSSSCSLEKSRCLNKLTHCINSNAAATEKHPQQLRVEATTHELTPNKCLAELERLRAEFRASESQRQKLQRRGRVFNAAAAMRLNVPATVVAAADATTITTAAATVAKIAAPVTVTTSSSSVFLTTSTNVACNNNYSSNNNRNNKSNSCNNNVNINTTTKANPCQRQPSLTIQVNNNSNNNNCNSNVVSCMPPTVLPTHLDYFVQQASVNNNGISVINCNYVQSAAISSINKNSSVAKNSSVKNGSDASSGVVSVNSSSSSTVPKVLNSSSSSGAKCISNSSVNRKKVSAVAAATTTYVSNESVNIINVNADPQQQQQQQTPTIMMTTNNGNTSSNTSANSTPNVSPSRTFTSTECQTDDISAVQLREHRPAAPTPVALTANTGHPINNNHNISVGTAVSSNSPSAIATREQRRRERRERRHQQQQLQQLQRAASQLPPHPHPSRRHSDRHSLPAPPPSHQHPHPHLHMHHGLPSGVPPNATMPVAMAAMLRPMLPDILHSHFPPPYSAIPGGLPNGSQIGPSPMGPQPPAPPPPPQCAAMGATLLTPVISTVPIPGATTIVSDGRFSIPLPIIRRSPSERSGKGCCGQWFAGPPLRALIAVVALGGVACALGGAALGATGLAGPPSSHFTAALLMIGVGVVLVTVSGAAWRMTAPGGPPCLGLGSSVDLGRCGRRPCSRGGGAPHGLLYPEFQHRPPPPSYQASMQEYRLRLLLLDRDRQNGVVRGNSPPPTYRSHAGSLLRAPLTTTSSTIRGIGGGGGGPSSIGGSEYSLPPSYRSRNTTPGGERSIETAPSGRLLANEDLPEPEPLCTEQLSNYNALQRHQQQQQLHLRQLSDVSLQARGTQPKTTAATVEAMPPAASSHQLLRTSAIVEVPATTHSVGSDKLQAHQKEPLSATASAANIFTSVGNGSPKGKELVTIVTISQNHSDMLYNESEGSDGRQQQQQNVPETNEQMEILAHL